MRMARDYSICIPSTTAWEYRTSSACDLRDPRDPMRVNRAKNPSCLGTSLAPTCPPEGKRTDFRGPQRQIGLDLIDLLILVV